MIKIITFLFLIISQSLSAREHLVITGSSTIAPVISDLAKLYESKNKEVRIDIQTGGSSRGILDIRKNISQIGMVSRSLKHMEQDLHGFTFAKDGLAIIVHKSNQIKNITKDQVSKIYRGQIQNWEEIGGTNAKIIVINKSEGRSTLELFLKFFKLKNSQIKADIIIGDNEQGIKSISTNQHAIAYVSIGSAIYNASIGIPLKLLDYQGIKASVKNIENEKYPLIRKLNLITKIKPIGHIKKFLSFVKSQKAMTTISEHYFVPTL